MIFLDESCLGRGIDFNNSSSDLMNILSSTKGIKQAASHGNARPFRSISKSSGKN